MARRKTATQIPVPKFYVYTLARPGGKVFYVGKGIGKRIDQHEKEAKRGHQCHKCNIIRKVWRAGEEIIKNVIFFNLTESEAFNQEALLIGKYGLANLSNVDPGNTVEVAVNLRPPSRPFWQLNAAEYRAFMIRQGYSRDDINREMREFLEHQLHGFWVERQQAIIRHDLKAKAEANEKMTAVQIALGRGPYQEELPFDEFDT